MNLRPSAVSATCRPTGLYRLAIVVLAGSTLAVAGCGDRTKDRSASQTAVRVNKEEVTVHQINLMLQLQRGLKPEQIDAASKQILEFLVDQELAVQKTRELKIDQDPRVMLRLENAKREVLARAYAERTGESASKPTAEEVKKYYDDTPALFKERRVYSLQELSIEAKPEQVNAFRDQLQRVKSVGEFVDYLKANNVRFNGNQGIRAAEQLPADVLGHVAKMKDSQMVLLPSPTGALVIVLVGARAEPVDEARATPAIEQFLLNEAKRMRIEADVKALRAAAKIEYIGKFAEAAASATAGSPTQPAAAAASPVAAAAPAAVASGMSAEDISRGLGIKK
jgi:EpsD family peptidyl-prolyl cis-trans isomerase